MELTKENVRMVEVMARLDSIKRKIAEDRAELRSELKYKDMSPEGTIEGLKQSITYYKAQTDGILYTLYCLCFINSEESRDLSRYVIDPTKAVLFGCEEY